LNDQPIARSAPLFFEHEGSRAVRDGKWKLVSLSGAAWELYDLGADPTEMNNLINQKADTAKKLSAAWEAWAKRCHVDTSTDWLGNSAAAERKSASSPPQPKKATIMSTAGD
jgi:arylsulfatase